MKMEHHLSYVFRLTENKKRNIVGELNRI